MDVNIRWPTMTRLAVHATCARELVRVDSTRLVVVATTSNEHRSLGERSSARATAAAANKQRRRAAAVLRHASAAALEIRLIDHLGGRVAVGDGRAASRAAMATTTTATTAGWLKGRRHDEPKKRDPTTKDELRWRRSSASLLLLWTCDEDPQCSTTTRVCSCAARLPPDCRSIVARSPLSVVSDDEHDRDWRHVRALLSSTPPLQQQRQSSRDNHDDDLRVSTIVPTSAQQAVESTIGRESRESDDPRTRTTAD